VNRTPTMQNKILDAMTTTITNRHLEAVQPPVYANTGTLYAQRGFETLLEISYRFNTTYMTHTVRVPAAVVEHLKQRPPGASLDIDLRGARLTWHHLTYTEGDVIAAMLNQLDQLLVPVSDQPTSTPRTAAPKSFPLLDTRRLATAIADEYPPHVYPRGPISPARTGPRTRQSGRYRGQRRGPNHADPLPLGQRRNGSRHPGVPGVATHRLTPRKPSVPPAQRRTTSSRDGARLDRREPSPISLPHHRRPHRHLLASGLPPGHVPIRAHNPSAPREDHSTQTQPQPWAYMRGIHRARACPARAVRPQPGLRTCRATQHNPTTQNPL
jgi:hypothetical protein